MATQLQFRRGTTAQNDAFTGAAGEVVIDTQSKNLRIHDGATAGGYELIPSGTIMAYGAATAPTGWLLCDATAILRASYPKLFAVIGTNYGAGNGTTTFNLPELRDRIPLGKGTNNTVLGATGTAAAASGVLTSASKTGVTTVASDTGAGTSGGTGSTTVATNTGSSGATTATSSTGSAESVTFPGYSTGTGTTGTGTTGSTTAVITATSINVAGSAKDSSLVNVLNSVSYSGHTHSVPGLSVPALSIPSMTVEAHPHSIPALTVSSHAHSIPALTVNSHTHSVPSLSIPSLNVNAFTVATALPYEVTNYIIKT